MQLGRKYWDLFFGFNGRIGRELFWLGILPPLALLLSGLRFARGHLGDWLFNRFVVQSADFSTRTLPLLLYALMIVLVLWPILALSVKRLHDRNKSGWLILPFYLLLFWFEKLRDGASVGVLPWGVGTAAVLILSAWCLVELGFLRGTDGPNRFGGEIVKAKALGE